MGVKAVYNQKYIGIYITGEDLDRLLKESQIFVPSFIYDGKTSPGQVYVAIDAGTRLAWRQVLTQETNIYDEARKQFRAEHPDYETADQRKRKARRANR